MSKSLCFSKEEFSVICHAYGITKLVCFEQKSNLNVNEDEILELYNQTLFQLYKKEYLDVTETGFMVSNEVKRIFSVLKKCDMVLTTFCREESVPGYCLYFSKNSEAVLMRAGSRVGEYVKVELLKDDEITEFIIASGVLLPDSIGADLSDVCADCEIEGVQLQEFLQSGDIESADNLSEIPEVVTLLKIQNPTTASKICYIALVKQPIQDYMMIVDDKGIQMVMYSINKVVEVFRKKWEDQNDIS